MVRKNHVYISNVNLNEGDVSIMWRLIAMDNKDEVENKARTVERVPKLNDGGEFYVPIVRYIRRWRR
ncbi:hypothetical protein [Vulcanisaeta distributa]|uniref:hypothetical protein n=1 Tax=Vulcanisaeta distributa TaxID=164451 RepID=UPI001FB4E405|nr:hypothetical protein [Vulcanisaeta distributa]